MGVDSARLRNPVMSKSPQFRRGVQQSPEAVAVRNSTLGKANAVAASETGARVSIEEFGSHRDECRSHPPGVGWFAGPQQVEIAGELG